MRKPSHARPNGVASNLARGSGRPVAPGFSPGSRRDKESRCAAPEPAASVPHDNAAPIPETPSHSQTREEPVATPLSRAELLAHLNTAIEGAAPAIVDAVIEHAKGGNYLHAKFLFDFAALAPVVTAPQATAERSLAATLLRALGVGDHDEAVVVPAASAGMAEQGSADVAPTKPSSGNGDAHALPGRRI